MQRANYPWKLADWQADCRTGPSGRCRSTDPLLWGGENQLYRSRQTHSASISAEADGLVHLLDQDRQHTLLLGDDLDLAGHAQLDLAAELAATDLVAVQLDPHQVERRLLTLRHAGVRRDVRHLALERAVLLIVVGVQAQTGRHADAQVADLLAGDSRLEQEALLLGDLGNRLARLQ